MILIFKIFINEMLVGFLVKNERWNTCLYLYFLEIVLKLFKKGIFKIGINL